MNWPNRRAANDAARTAIIWTLLQDGFARPDADEWVEAWAGPPDPALVSIEAIAFDDHGMPLARAIAWHLQGFYSFEAACLDDLAWTPREAATVRDLAGDDSAFVEWSAMGLPASRVTLYLRAHVGPDEVAGFEALDQETEHTLLMLTALLQ